MKIRFIYSFLFVLFITTSATAWNETAHRIIATIAYDRLSSESQKQVDKLTWQLFHYGNGYQRFLQAAAWPDSLRRQRITLFDAWHYINLPWSPDRHKTIPPPKNNLRYALDQSMIIVKRRSVNNNLRVFMLTMLVHLTGDAHQPLHCITLFSHDYPGGDSGGNQYKIDEVSANNLHTFWDQGLGLFSWSYMSRQAYLGKIRTMADQLTTAYPVQFFGARAIDTHPADWIQQGYATAIKYVYMPLVQYSELKHPPKLSADYIKKGQQVAAEQTVLAGYRLAAVLNSLLSEKKFP